MGWLIRFVTKVIIQAGWTSLVHLSQAKKRISKKVRGVGHVPGDIAFIENFAQAASASLNSAAALAA